MILGKDQHPNGDLNWIRKLLLLFIVPNWPSAIEQFLFLFCLLIVLSGLWTGFKNSIDYIGLGFFILPAWMLGYDVLLRRALAKLTPWVSKAESILVPTHADPTIV